MHKQNYAGLGETVYTETLENGLRVCLIPKPGFQQVYATFTTHYGSIDRVFRTVPDEPYITVPDGIAHFLEHKMFESEDGDVFHEFAKYGASANAFTTFDLTTYLFSCTENVLENTTTLLDFVQDPYFTVENVEKEKGIIGQEIRMYDDNPDWRAFFGLLKAMYKDHPVRIDIAGTVESIAEITKDTLYSCYRTFYHPGNMIFCAVGGFDADAVMHAIRENQQAKSFGPIPEIQRGPIDEPAPAATPRTTAELGVSQSRCLIGYKDAHTGCTGRTLLKQELLTGVILDALFGRSSELYHELIDAELIDQQFSWEYELTPSYGYSLLGGNTTDPDELQRRITNALEQARSHGISEEVFDRSRKKAIGRFMASLDSANYIARNYTAYAVKDANLFETVDVLQSLTVDEANVRAKEHFQPSQQAVSLVVPK